MGLLNQTQAQYYEGDEYGGYDYGAAAAAVVLLITYFSPLLLGLLKEIVSIALRMLQYLKTISKK